MTTNTDSSMQVRTRVALSVRQSQLLCCLERGWTIAEVAVLWGVTVGTLATHMRAIFFKLSARTRNHALAISIRNAYI